MTAVYEAIMPSEAQLESFKPVLEYFWENPIAMFVMTIFTLWSLFNDDIRTSATDKSADAGFEGLITAIFFVFVLEFLSQCFYRKGKLFYFHL